MNRTILVLLAAVAMTAGCLERESIEPEGPSRVDLQAEVRKQAEQIGELEQTVAAQREQIDTLQQLGGEKRLEKLYYPVRVEIGRYTGGVDTDGAPGDDAVRVYLRPIDQDGHAIKAAGRVKVQLFDLAAAPERNLLFECTYDELQVRRCWSGGFMAYHYTFECPWKSPPPHNELTVRVEFTDYLTGKTFSNQKVVTVAVAERP